ncbi:hypothetical protein QN277_027092 [Acacia crassicarpa]|uniref:WAT1-related protein n=1 Tax=Acacia crassicarpa TaxID=499986 RepID=A0AAE1MIJ3_9FABA|nr:hypothetical protein QN277_027092 [Acacia crassicarpa]
MERKGCGIGGVFFKFKAHLLMILLQLGYSFVYFIADSSFQHGFNPYVYVTYRNIVAGLALLPFAFFLERKTRPKLTLALFLEIFVLSLLGASLSLNMYFASLKYTNPTFATILYNTLASITFIIAAILRVEVINLRNPRSIAKVLGTVVSLGGVMIVTLYRGPIIRNIWPPLIHIHKTNHIHEEWLKGSLLAIASCVAWAIWFIMQGVVASGLFTFVQMWCTEEKGPVFVTMFNPLLTVLVALLSYFVVGDKLHLGCIVGAIIVVIDLYLLIWGKEEEQVADIKIAKERLTCNSDDPEKQDNLDL